MLSESATSLMAHFAKLYKQTGINEFNIDSYSGIPNCDIAIRELLEKGYLNESTNILQTLSINFDAIER